MKLVFGALWAILGGLTWAESWVIRKARTLDGANVALRERQIASTCRATSLTIGGFLGANRMAGGVIPERLVWPLLSVALALNAIPAIRFLAIYYRHGFRKH